MESRLITYPDFENNKKYKYFIVDATQFEVAALIKQLSKKDPIIDFYFWNGENTTTDWAKKVWNASDFVLLNTQSTLDLTNDKFNVKKVVRYNNVQELFKFIYER